MLQLLKGLAFPYDIPCISVSTLEAITYNFTDENTVICAVMDARRMQFYNALLKWETAELHDFVRTEPYQLKL